jgi:hypothetical protein
MIERASAVGWLDGTGVVAEQIRAFSGGGVG